jgi:hypothetical protein
MPLTLTVGLSKKKGLPEYGSVGASCSVAVELDGSVLENDMEAFQSRVKKAYTACARAINDELSHQQVHDQPPATSNGHAHSNGNGHAATTSNGNGHRASDKQLDYARQLACQIRGLGVRRLEALAEKMFNKPIAELSTLDGSGLIDTLKAIKAGEVKLADALDRAAV